MPARTPTPGALKQREYQRAYRERLKHGLLGFSGYAPPALVDDLIDAGLLPEEEVPDKKSLAAAIMEAASLWARNRGGENSC